MSWTWGRKSCRQWRKIIRSNSEHSPIGIRWNASHCKISQTSKSDEWKLFWSATRTFPGSCRSCPSVSSSAEWLVARTRFQNFWSKTCTAHRRSSPRTLHLIRRRFAFSHRWPCLQTLQLVGADYKRSTTWKAERDFPAQVKELVLHVGHVAFLVFDTAMTGLGAITLHGWLILRDRVLHNGWGFFTFLWAWLWRWWRWPPLWSHPQIREKCDWISGWPASQQAKIFMKIELNSIKNRLSTSSARRAIAIPLASLC